MKKRIRKKKHLAEYAVFGNSLKLSFSQIEDNDFIDLFLERIESLVLQFGGSVFDGVLSGVIEPVKARALSQSDINNLNHWLINLKHIDSFTLSESWDLYYGTNPFEG